jgi:hypothetical protein
MSLSNITRAHQIARAAASVADVNQSSIKVSGLKLGQVANLLLGYKPGWTARDSSTAPFFPADIAALPTMDVEVSMAETVWQLPRITLHKDRNSLLSAIFPYIVQSLTGDGSTFSLPSGPLMVNDLDGGKTLDTLSKYLGVDLTAGGSYMLVELVRSVGTASHPYTSGAGGDEMDHLTPNALEIITALPGVAGESEPTHRLTAGDARPFLQSFQTLGTHYVSKVTAGDRIFQVFAYDQPAFDRLTSAFNNSAKGTDYVDGLNAMPFQYYTTPHSTSTGVPLGYVKARGIVNIVSDDPDFAESVKAGLWNDSERAGGNSIFMAYKQTGPPLDLSRFQAVVPIGFELTPLGNLIPVDKCAAGRNYWNRLLKGALHQKHGQQVRVTFPPAHSYQWQDLLPNSGAWLSTIATPTVNVYDARVALGAIKLTNRPAVKKFSS